MKKQKDQNEEMNTAAQEVEQNVNDSMIATEETDENLFNADDIEMVEEPANAESVSSDEIFSDMSDDEDMPEPETADYGTRQTNPNAADANRTLVPTEKFMELFKSTTGQLPYSSILKCQTGSIKLSDLYKFVEAKAKLMTVNEMNTVINFIAGCPFEVVRPLMEIVENPGRQTELWTLNPE